MKYQNELVDLIEHDPLIMETLSVVRSLNLNDCWIGAGFIRNKVWDILHDQKTTDFNDIDVVFFDDTTISVHLENEIEQQLTAISPKMKWSVKNQARMYIRNNHLKYNDTENAISYWPETATAVAARLSKDDKVEVLAPYGLNDLFNLIIRPTPNTSLIVFQERMSEKQWKKQWGNLKLIDAFV
ncbi:nucleotidyltransferase family protein [Flavobacterium sp. MC2016-06]|uniref:nucleotidyltransferase family protein n=1 Tax=Flavobacterium sp. MC2016-06 TaxID=2676308 RepID=UPI0012BAAC52|nr:nucleotidyltransferase family protein [Flavobacterium sp. MC2016-06]MBU3859659.1 nucleotidyltransferase family protein [Flavobacterium sp. MC2016-06]